MATSRDVRKVLKISGPPLKEIRESLDLLANWECLAGFPEDTTQRDDPEEDREITNASLGYIHNTGMPEQNIPARPFMHFDGTEDRLAAALKGAAVALLTKKSVAEVERHLERVGLIAQAALRANINAGVPPPLSEVTLQERARRGRKGAKTELERRAQGETPSTEFAKPLVDTAQMRNALNYVIRKRKERDR